MKIVNGLAPGTLKLAKASGDISKAATQRLKWFDYYYSHGQNARLTCGYFGISHKPSIVGKDDMTRKT